MTEQFDETSPTVSPDGKWLAYASNETGRFEVYVRPFPDTDAGRWQISTNGGTGPVWAHSGWELFYLGASEMIAAQLTTEPAFTRREQRALFSHGSEYVRGNTYSAYDVSPDDQRFVMIRPIISGAAQGQDSTRLMLDWGRRAEPPADATASGQLMESLSAAATPSGFGDESID